MAKFDLAKITSEFNKASLQEKEDTIQTLEDLFTAELIEQQEKLKLEQEILDTKIQRILNKRNQNK